MDVNRKPKLRDDFASDAWSFGSNYHQSSQSRKMSIGIVIDSVAKCSQKLKQVEDQAHTAAVKTSSKGTSVEDGTTMSGKTSSKGNFTNDRNKKEKANASAVRNQREPTEQQTSPWISTKTLHHEPTLEAVTPAEKPSFSKGVSEMSNRSNRVEEGPAKSFVNQTRTLQFDKSKKVRGDAATERGGKFASKTALEDMPEKEVKVKNTKAESAGNATLRLKLREILGTVASQNTQRPDSLVPKQDARTSQPEKKDSGYHVGEPRQNSDTIETDTQSHEYAIRRPITRSLARKRPPAKLKSQSRKRPPACKEDLVEKNVFLPKDRWCRNLGDGGTDSPLMVYERRGKRKSHHIEASTICEQNKERKDEDTRNNSKRVPVPEKFVYPGVAAGNGTTLFPEKNNEMVQLNADNLESPVVEMTEQLRNLQEHIDQKGNSAEKSKRRALDSESDKQSLAFATKKLGRKSFPGLAPRSNLGELHGDGHENRTSITEQLRNLQGHIDQKGNSAEKSNRKALDSESDKESLTFAMKAPARKSFPGFAPRSNLGQLHGDGNENITSKTEGICKVKSFDGLKREYKSNTPDESSDDAGNLESSPFLESRPIMEEDTQIRFSKPLSMESDPDGSEDSSNIQADTQPPSSPEMGKSREQQAPRPNKRLFNKGCANLSGVSPAAASSKGINCRKLERRLEQNEEDPLTSAITLFAFSLEKVRSKLKSVCNQRSAEILKSVAEKIHMQLQNAEFQIQADMGRITSLNKSKRKHVEEVLQEKQQHLNAIYETFKEEVNRHLQDCKSTLESLEAHEVEVKAIVEKRKASNKKLLLEVEEAIETQLDNAEKRVSSVHHAAREKMRQLKFVVAECLKEGVLG
ncbi:meiosis-specific protein ASY3 [Lycium ferocissimum]|uniref:meiosis-specific protein ASY3 n=1 Tax=Lycium ferocissimum TaxID=112874 RepID=UPI00281654FB|nr:meiosis-specific protein ASY3 [Lycium ferocissimum]